jgi:hypothetical protein
MDMELGEELEAERPLPFSTLPLRFAQIGSAVRFAGVLMHFIIVTLERNIERALQTAAHMAEVLQFRVEHISIVYSIDGKQHDLPGKEALFHFYQAILLPQVRAWLPGAGLYTFTEDDVRLDLNLSKGWPHTHFQNLVHKINGFNRPITVLGYQRRDLTVEYNHRKPDYGLFMWTVRSEFLGTLADLLKEQIPDHIDMTLYGQHGTLLGYSSYSIAGYVAHVSDCADPQDPNVVEGIRPEYIIRMHKDDYKELVIVPYVK